MKFKGTIVITDPCYIDTEDDKIWRGKEVDIFSKGKGLEKFGFTQWIWENTIYGDWSCATFDNKEETLGYFCADAGFVGVFYLDEILAFNPNYKYPVNEYGCEWATVIEDFDGDVEYIVDENDEAHIEGKGNINFITRQTGF